ncbi:extracellular solute-binding protein [Streptomyces sp. B1866]|uniref:extracellular solute-binding protein n=1 Tax=Streptomyces sp. B1866 TaxID=3075431 RepID=UPI00288F8FAF|nr:extracellular solute-binding protein [Streptomyces sp. B1866]MDT3398405.1 extracellular solute-binding protein [Streptomyces sp. B1866]
MRPAAPLILAAILLAAALPGLAACGSGTDPNVVKVAYNRSTNTKNRFKDAFLTRMKKQFEKANPGKRIKLVPIQAQENDYATKVQQMMRSDRTAPDVVYEDTFRMGSDIEAGYLRPLDRYLRVWRPWERFAASAKEAVRAADGRTYGVPDGTDTRALWYDRAVFARAGLPADWRPRDWDDVLDAARTVRRRVPDVVPLNVYTGKAPGEGAVMQGFEMLLYGTGDDPLYDAQARRWVTGGAGFRQALGFVRTVYREHLGPDVSDALDANVSTAVTSEWLPEGRLAIDLDGSWLGQYWLPSGSRPWPAWSTRLAYTPMPTRTGAPPGRVSMSGGWAWAVSARCDKPDLAWKFVETLQTQRNAADWDIVAAQIAVRSDVARDPRYLRSMPSTAFFTDLVRDTHYRPALPAYPRVSSAIGEALEAVTTGDSSPEAAARAYDRRLRSITDGAVTAAAHGGGPGADGGGGTGTDRGGDAGTDPGSGTGTGHPTGNPTGKAGPRR